MAAMNDSTRPDAAPQLGRRAFVLGMLPAALAAAQPRSPQHVLVYRQPGRFGGWPANHGIWSWGNEILVGFSAGYFKHREWMYHQNDPAKPEVPAFARSLDGGSTWTVREAPEQMLPRWGGKTGGPLDEPMEFTHPGFAWTMRFNDSNVGPTVYWYSLDKGSTWLGPFEFPALGLRGIPGRTNFLVFGRHDAMAFLTASKTNGREGRPFCARTRDGGMTWEFVSYLCPEPAGFAIMPAAVALRDGTLVATVRCREPGPAQRDWIDTYSSSDQGKTWTKLAPAAPDTGRGGNPASMLALPDGRIVVVYGYRNEPYSMRARLSSDGGRSWGDEIFLRRDGKAPDLGYPRSILRPDGAIVSLYYFNDDVHNERFIEAAIWRPGA
jgi:hypothetical protein